MRFSRRVNYLLLGALVFLNIALRFPKGLHEEGYDSFFIHVLSNSIVDAGHAKWVLHPMSLYGLYPLSYPSSQPFLLAGGSLLSGIDMEMMILLNSIVLGLIGVFEGG